MKYTQLTPAGRLPRTRSLHWLKRIDRFGDGVSPMPLAGCRTGGLSGAAAFCIEAVDESLARHGKPDIFNTDQGSQLTSRRF